MSTKNLARTVIEAGRARWNRIARRHSNASERAWERVISHKLLTATELDDVIYRRRDKIYRGQHDKLAPAERWLRSQAGRPWAKVRSELFARFDARTTQGRHLIFDHVLKSIHRGTPVRRGLASFTIDRFGVLRVLSHRRRRFDWKAK